MSVRWRALLGGAAVALCAFLLGYFASRSFDLGSYIGQLGAAAVALVGALIGGGLSYIGQFQLERVRDTRAFRETKYQQVAADYEVVLGAALQLKRSVEARSFLSPGEDPQARDAELSDHYDRIVANLDKARVRLLLEPKPKPR